MNAFANLPFNIESFQGLPDIETLEKLQKQIQGLLKKSLDIQKQNFSAYKKTYSFKDLIKMRNNPLVKLKLKQLFQAKSTGINSSSRFRVKPKEGYVMGQGAFKFRRAPSDEERSESEASN